tara:strand:+ start:46 stop:591 length:546 start_codon:yes stop_codon:yes gene_type:complete
MVAILAQDNLLDIGSASAIGEFELVMDLADLQVLLSSQVASQDTAIEDAADSLEFTLFAQDRLRLQTDSVYLYAQVGADGPSYHEVSLMPPTLKVLTPAINVNEGVTLAGSAVPYTDVVIVIRGSGQEHTVVSGLDGFWSVWLPGPWEPGGKTVDAFNRDAQGLVSSTASTTAFTVVQASR